MALRNVSSSIYTCIGKVPILLPYIDPVNPYWWHQSGIWLPWPRFTYCCKICGSKHTKIPSMWCVGEISADLNILSFPNDLKKSIPLLIRSQNIPNKYNCWLFLHESAENWNSWGISRSWQAMQHCRDSSPAHFWKQWEDGCMAARLCKSIFSFVAEMLTFHLQMKTLRSAAVAYVMWRLPPRVHVGAL